MLLGALPRFALAFTFGQSQPAPGADPDLALRACDLLVTEGKSTTAIPCYEGIRAQFVGTAQAHDAERALWMLRSVPPPPAAPPVPSVALRPPPSPPRKESYYVLEPYSSRTKERLRLTTWEKLDFGVSAFLYGLSTGASFGLAGNRDNVLGAMAVGALAYSGLAVGYLNSARIDRGDLPLALAISAYLPLTTGFLTLAVHGESSEGNAEAVAVSGVLALPLAYWAASVTDLDPGDTQLVRDAGFWGAVWGVGLAGATVDSASNPRIGIGGMVGLYGGMGLGLLLAHETNISLERVRVTTWGGYGGTLLGVLTSFSTRTTERHVWTSLVVGGALGVLVTFVSTGSIDAVPANADFAGGRVSMRYLEPALLPVVDWQGRTRPQAGMSLLRGSF